MSEFSELIKKFDKIRDYMRDFYIYGFKSRTDFTGKSARTYDNEKRRIESYMGDYMKWDYTGGNKTSFISVDCTNIPVNPLYAAWKSKSFTANDIMLHFYILDVLKKGPMTVDRLTDHICDRSGMTFEVQTVRNKCREYVELGMLSQEKQGRAFVYSTEERNVPVSEELIDAVRFFQGSMPFGEVGSYILDKEGEENDLFAFKHQYIAHTLEDGILFELLSAIRQCRFVELEHQSNKTGHMITVQALPLKIFVSAGTGRRFVCMYSDRTKRFMNYRLDYVKQVKQCGICERADVLREKLEQNLHKVWGVGFGGVRRSDFIAMKLHIDEQKEQFIIDRIKREGQDGELIRLEQDTYLFTREVFDMNDMSPWIKTFTGRILALEGTNPSVVKRFYDDMEQMAGMYGIDAGGDC